MTWKELSKIIQIQINRTKGLEDETAMVVSGDTWYELDLYRSMSTQRMVIGPAYGPMKEAENETENTS